MLIQLVLFGFVAFANAATTVCSSPNALATGFTVAVSNDKPTKGENVSTTFDFDLPVAVTGGIARYAATFNGFPYSSTALLCDEVAKTGDPCPLVAGHHHQVSTSAATTSGKIVVKITWNTESGAEILCAEITTKVA
jgi:hypothetical protein